MNTPDNVDDGQRLARIRSLHDRLLAGDREGVEEAVRLFRRPFLARLTGRPRFRQTDPQMVEDAVLDALLEYAEKPAQFDPSSGRVLEAHLTLAAERNLLNLLRSEGRRHRREREAAAREAPGNRAAVELQSPAGNLLQEETATELQRNRDEALALLTDPRDRRVYELRLEGEFRTTAFAAVLGIRHLPKDDQRREVKRVKDRIEKVLRRGIGTREAGHA